MKFSPKSILPAVLALVMCFASCKNCDIADPLDGVGADADVVFVANPKAIFSSLGAASISDLSSRLKAEDIDQLNKLKDIKGLSFDRVAISHYRSLNEAAIIMAVEDRGDLEKSLGTLGYESTETQNRNFFIDKAHGVSYVVDDEFLRVLQAASLTEAEELADSLVSLAAKPLPQWKRDILEEDNTATSLTNAGEKSVSLAINISGKKASLRLKAYDTELGKSVAWLPDGSYEHIGEWASGVKNDVLLSFAVAKVDFSKALSDTRRLLGLSRSEVAIASALLSGPIYGDLDFSGAQMTDFDKIAANLTVTSVSPNMAESLLSGMSGELRNMNIPVAKSGSGFTAEFEGAKLTGSTDGNKVVLKTGYQTGSSTVSLSGLADCIAWVSFNIPKELVATLISNEDFGMKGDVLVKDTEINANMEFTDTEGSFLENLMKLRNL